MAKNEVVLCDTNIFINLFRGHPKARVVFAKIGAPNIALSIVTYAEVIYGTKKTDVSRVKQFLERYSVIDIDVMVSQAFKGLALNYSNHHHIKIPDALIASTAIAYGYPLYTENKKDFDFIPEVKLYKS